MPIITLLTMTTAGRCCGLMAVVLSVTGAAQAQTPAGTAITNVATVTYRMGDAEQRAQSNAVTLMVAERLDIVLVRGDDIVRQVTADPVAVPVTLTNGGSGDEAFAVTADSSTATATVRAVAVDRDGDGHFDPAVDTVLHGTTPMLAPGETLMLVAVVAPTGGVMAADGALMMTAQAVTGSGDTEDLFAGRGDGGGDAVVGRTGAVASVTAPFLGVSPAAPTIIKTQAVRAPDGSASPVSGAVVTYTLTARFPAGATRGVRIDDPVPAGTTYLPGTLSLDGQPLSEAADGDAGVLAGGAVAVTLGDVAPAATHAVSFQVRLP